MAIVIRKESGRPHPWHFKRNCGKDCDSHQQDSKFLIRDPNPGPPVLNPWRIITCMHCINYLTASCLTDWLTDYVGQSPYWEANRPLAFLGAFAKLRKRLLASSCLFVCPSVRPHGSARLPLDGFSWNLIFEYFSKICRENSRFIKIWQE